MASWQDVPKGITGTGATGYISFWSGANSLSANTNLFWDNVNNRLGIGISSPDAVVDIEGILKLLDGTQGAGKALISDTNGVKPASWQTVGASSWSVVAIIYSNNSGNVGIGYNQPSCEIACKGKYSISDTTDNSSGNVMIGTPNNVVNAKLYVKKYSGLWGYY